MLDLEQQIFRQLEKSQNPLIVFPNDWSSDSVASALALFLFLKKIGLNPEIAASPTDKEKHHLSFLPSFSDIQSGLHNLRRFIVSLDISQAKVQQIKYTVDESRLNFIISPSTGWFRPENVTSRADDFKYDLIIVLGASDLESLGKIYDDNIEFFYKTTIINIDNHPANEEFGQINFVDLNSVATSETLFYLLKNYKGDLIDEDAATCLLAGIIQQTKNFKTPNLTPRTLLTSSQLITLGGRREEIVNNLYRSRDISSLKLWGKILNNLKSENNDEILWSKLSTADFQDSGASPVMINDLVDELMVSVPNAKLIVLMYETEQNKSNINLYALKNNNALDLIKEYSPQGSPRAAQALTDQSVNQLANELIPALKKKLDKLIS